MNKKRFYSAVSTLAAVLLTLGILSTVAVGDQDPLPSWNEGAAKKSIVAFVEKVTKQGSPDFVPVAERIATFDNESPQPKVQTSLDRAPLTMALETMGFEYRPDIRLVGQFRRHS